MNRARTDDAQTVGTNPIAPSTRTHAGTTTGTAKG